jgi:predicted dehydrogenase/threonine dehydrogenase-like Zn-dependent dehydrogenase
MVRSSISVISTGTERQLLRLAQATLLGKAIARPDLVHQTLNKMRRDGVVETVGKVFSKLDTPTPLGYSLAGTVVDLDPSVTGFSVGDRVACAGAGYATHAELNVIPKHLCTKLPPAVSNEDAAFVTLGAIALQGVRQAQPQLDERFVVLGLGLIGLLTIQILKANGCRVLGFDPDVERAKLALALGADDAVASDLPQAALAFTDGVGADGVIVAASSPSNEPIQTAAEISRAKGRVVVVGLVGMNLERDQFYRKELDLRLSMSYGPGRYDPSYEDHGHDYPIAYVRWTEGRNMAAFVHLISAGKVTPARLISHRYPIADAADAYKLLASSAPCLGILLTYPTDAPLVRRLPVTANKPVENNSGNRIGFIGAGSFARDTLMPLASAVPGATLTVVATKSGSSARHAAKKFGFRFAASDPAEVIADEATDTVVIATRHSTHAQLVVSALQHGKHVFCEKPLALTKEELDKVMSAANGSKTLLAVGFNRRFAPYILATKQWLSGHAGPLVMTYRVNAGTLPAAHWSLGEEGGGRIIGEVCHFVDAMASLVGAPVLRVSAHRPPGSSDSVVATLVFAGGSVGTIVYTALGDASLPKEFLEVFAPGRAAILDDFRKLSLVADGKTRRRRTFRRDKGHKALLAAFVKATQSQGPLPMTLAEIANVTSTTFAIESALRDGREVAVVM